MHVPASHAAAEMSWHAKSFTERLRRPCSWRVVVIGLLAIAASVAGCAGGGGSDHAGPRARGVAPDFAAVYRRHAVAADHPLASAAGLEVLRAGGNAVDAAVATSFALSVVRPFSCGIGGGGFMVIHFEPWQQPRATEPPEGPTRFAINYREMAPAAATPGMFASPDLPTGAASPSRTGGMAAGVPGTVAGLLHAHAAFGLLSREQVIAPAIRLAEQGFEADAAYARAAASIAKDFAEHPEWRTRFAFVWERFLHRGSVDTGDMIHVPEQAEALRLIARDGAHAFYQGPIAEAIIRAVRSDGGVMTRDDLLGFRTSTSDPLAFEFYGRRFLTMPPPSSGGITMAQTLGLLARAQDRAAITYATRPDAPPLGGESPSQGRHVRLGIAAAWAAASLESPLLIEAFKLAFADRAAWLGDPAFVPVPLDRLLSEGYLDARAGLIDLERTHGPEHYLDDAARVELSEDGGTSHLSVVDQWGNAVACTETINLEFGSLLAVPEYGFILNDQMDDFTSRVDQPNAYGLRQSARNLPAPGKRPLSSMTPTIVLDADGRVEIVAGASGGPRIITGTTQAVLHAIAGATARQAVAAPRFHHQWMPSRLDLEPEMRDEPFQEPGGEPTTFEPAMHARGHETRTIERLCVVQLIRRDRVAEVWQAASDPRKGGRPAGD